MLARALPGDSWALPAGSAFQELIATLCLLLSGVTQSSVEKEQNVAKFQGLPHPKGYHSFVEAQEALETLTCLKEAGLPSGSSASAPDQAWFLSSWDSEMHTCTLSRHKRWATCAALGQVEEEDGG